MKTPPRFLVRALLCLAVIVHSDALELRSYNSSVHDRFVSFPEEPAYNPSFLLDADKHTGIGWGSENSRSQFALISRCHAVFAAHNAPSPGSKISFLSSSGMVVERKVASVRSVTNPTASTSDLALITLSQPIDESEGVEPLPYLNLPTEEDYLGLPLVVFGSQLKAGQGSLTGFRTINVNWIVSRTFQFDYLPDEGDSDDARLTGGDSGSPSLVDMDGAPALLGVHLATSSEDGVQTNFDAFIPHYIEQIDAIIAPDGFRMRALNAPQTLLTSTSDILSTAFRPGSELEASFSLVNIGGHATGNLEVHLEFQDGTGPTSIQANGWVSQGAGSQWTLRRDLLDHGDSSLITMHWDEAPAATSIRPEIRWSSDSAPDGTLSGTITLAPDFSSWASEHGVSDQLDDPDRDGLPNLIEYAFGSDPTSGSGNQGTVVPPSPRFEIRDGFAIYTHPERTDKDERNLVYRPEWSARMQGWSDEAPPGLTSSFEPYSPEIRGFVERRLSWPVGEGHRFIRLNITD